jgi:hypothetical protein
MVGLDVSLKRTSICVVNQAESIVRERRRFRAWDRCVREIEGTGNDTNRP